jgi:hypothetical protein
MIKTRIGALLVLALAGCGSDPPPCASITKDVTLTDSPLVRMANLSLIRAGDSFTLAGWENGQVLWGRLTLDGTVTPEAGFAMAQPKVGPVFAVTKRTNPGDQIIALAVVNSATVSEGYDLVAIVQTVGEAAPATPVVLASLPPGTDTTLVQLAAGGAASGNFGYVAWGTRVAGIDVQYLLLPADAITAAAPSKMFNVAPSDVPDWDCLQSTHTPSGFSFSVVTPLLSNPPTSRFVVEQVDESGDAPQMNYDLTVAVVNCRIVGSPTPDGSYFMALQGSMNGSSAIDFATYYPPSDPTKDGSVMTYDPVMSSALFGDPMNMPRPAWVTWAGGDVVFGLVRPSGPQVVRYTYSAAPHGAKLPLRSVNGQTGALSAWVGQDAVYVTYADEVKSGGATSTKRYFMRIESPSVLP